MADPRQVVGVLILAEFVVVGAVLLFVGPVEAVAPVVPLLAVFTAVLVLFGLSWSRGDAGG